MAARSDSLLSRTSTLAALATTLEAGQLSRHERVARIQRRRRLTQAAAAFESFLWVTGAIAVTAFAIAGLTGLH